MIPGVEDWGEPRRVTRTDRRLGLDESFKVFASVSVAGGKLGQAGEERTVHLLEPLRGAEMRVKEL